jgi:hypothetical protein
VIGVSTNDTELETAAEFFELFKIPWERAVPGKRYRVVLSTDGPTVNLNTDLLLAYGSEDRIPDAESVAAVEHTSGPVDVTWGDWTFPIYGRVRLFGTGASVLACGGRPVDVRRCAGSRVTHRVGYDLFHEIRHLLTEGQPPSRAAVPTLELHIGLLRHLLLESRVPFAEIPPRPDGYDFTCCLTHDVDFFGIRRHKFDRTLAGFVARASVGTLADLVRGRRPLGDALRNWVALLSLPRVFLGVGPDLWQPFDDYARVEEPRRSTFFLAPFKGRPGVAPDGTVNPSRAVRYAASDIAKEASAASSAGTEIALHGIDAWRDEQAGRDEIGQIKGLNGRKRTGVRMHWLYFAADSPQKLEAAGFDYDSTWGYNETVGYRAGTSQVFRLTGSEGLMELPLSIMDTALLFAGRMRLTEDRALALCKAIVTNARQLGGTLVINWHDRSLAPERLWGRCYRDLLKEIGDGNRVWFATAGEAVDWFRWRRSIRFTIEPDSDRVRVDAPPGPAVVPPASIRVHRPEGGAEIRFDGREPVTV